MKLRCTIRAIHLVFLILVSTSLVYIMAGLIIFQEEVFIEMDHLAISELAIGIGFGLLVIAGPVSVIWLSSRMARRFMLPTTRAHMMIFGVVSFLLLFVEKTMVDEIAKELPVGMNTMGEWIILYACLFLQFIFQIGMTVQMAKLRQKKGWPATGGPSLIKT